MRVQGKGPSRSAWAKRPIASPCFVACASRKATSRNAYADLVLGVVAGVDRLAAGHLPSVRLDERGALVEAHCTLIGARAQALTDEAGGQRVERLGHLGALIAGDQRLAPERHLVRLERRRQESGSLLRLEVLERHPLRARVPTAAVLLAAPVPGPLLRLLQRVESLAGEAVVAHRLHRPLDTRRGKGTRLQPIRTM